MKKIYILLFLIVVLAAALRFYKLDSAPPSLSWDEAAVGYNAYTIANFGRDEYGKFFPAFFRSFADDKHPVHIYSTAISVKLLGLSEFSTRFPSAIFGVLNVLLIFFLAKLMFSSEVLGLFASLFLAVSPYNIHFSRFNHEANFALFFFTLGLLLFYMTIKKGKGFLPLSAFSFGISFITYHPAKIVVPVTVFLLAVTYGKQLMRNKRSILGTFLVALIFFLLIFFNPQLLGLARVNQTSLGRDGRFNLVLTQYSWFFSPDYLFVSGDKNPRLSDQGTGQFYALDALFLILGAFYLVYKRSKEGVVLLAWALVAPLPSALAAEAPHGARAMYMMGSWNLVAALGFYFLYLMLKKVLRTGLVLITIATLAISLFGYLNHYYGEYIKKNAIDWQYGMKQIVAYVKDHPKYPYVYMTSVRSQPYIFFLYYLKTPLPEYLNSVVYNRLESKSYNTVLNYGRYYFAGWDATKDQPNREALYILTPSEYDGLLYRSDFDVKKVIYYPNDTTAFFIVSMTK